MLSSMIISFEMIIFWHENIVSSFGKELYFKDKFLSNTKKIATPDLYIFVSVDLHENVYVIQEQLTFN